MCADFQCCCNLYTGKHFFLVNLRKYISWSCQEDLGKMELISYLHCISDRFIYDSGIGRCTVTNDYFYLFILFQPVSKNPFSLFQHSNESIQICVANNDIVCIPFLHKTINANTTSCLFYLHLKNAFSSKATIETETFFPKK